MQVRSSSAVLGVSCKELVYGLSSRTDEGQAYLGFAHLYGACVECCMVTDCLSLRRWNVLMMVLRCKDCRSASFRESTSGWGTQSETANHLSSTCTANSKIMRYRHHTPRNSGARYAHFRQQHVPRGPCTAFAALRISWPQNLPLACGGRSIARTISAGGSYPRISGKVVQRAIVSPSTQPLPVQNVRPYNITGRARKAAGRLHKLQLAATHWQEDRNFHTSHRT